MLLNQKACILKNYIYNVKEHVERLKPHKQDWDGTSATKLY